MSQPIPLKTRPVPNDVEHFLDNEDFIVTKTDARGIIIYANDAFVELSGYEESELIGRSHNLVRHPDMPKAAFKDLWSKVQSGEEWRGFVKNLRKDGGFYWVEALVTPSRENGEIVGFMSVRRKASKEEIERCTKLYAEMRQDEKRSA